ncbi:protein EPIDERMAL PATTERNING FACTOR 2-like [Diospyros lotus]|uniref:protein EPIDERMAL PATTERNING FACTOR 2-like n=1 Tax=Diospyros lotus TaxID=55363 RepID=UPI00225A8185|nr:protein EPIDERMAL PATTERNING FACTOR 2-like [Diospyros lotus]
MKKSNTNIIIPPFFFFFTTVAILFMVLAVAHSLRPHHYSSSTFNGKATQRGDALENPMQYSEINGGGLKEELGMELYPTGSSLPDCSHACGSCFPCKRVMVSFKCSTESCPIVYRCMCKGKYYHVPSN